MCFFACKWELQYDLVVSSVGSLFWSTFLQYKYREISERVSFHTCCNENVAPIPEREFLPDRAPNGQPNWQLTGSYTLKNHYKKNPIFITTMQSRK